MNRLARAVYHARVHQLGDARHGQLGVQPQIRLVVENAESGKIRRRRPDAYLYGRAVGDKRLDVFGDCLGFGGGLVQAELGAQPVEVDVGELRGEGREPSWADARDDVFERGAALGGQGGDGAAQLVAADGRRIGLDEPVDVVGAHEGVAVSADERGADFRRRLASAPNESALVPSLRAEGDLPAPVGTRHDGERGVNRLRLARALVNGLERERERQRRIGRRAFVFVRAPVGADEVFYLDVPTGVQKRREVELRNGHAESRALHRIGAVGEGADNRQRLLRERNHHAVAVRDDCRRFLRRPDLAGVWLRGAHADAAPRLPPAGDAAFGRFGPGFMPLALSLQSKRMLLIVCREARAAQIDFKP